MTEFDDFYAAHYADVVVQIYAYFGDRQEAQDVVQEAFCRALARWTRLAAYDDPVAWVRRVAWNLRRAIGDAPERLCVFCVISGRNLSWTGSTRTGSRYCPRSRHCPPVQRRAMVLRYLVDLSVAEIAAREGVAEATVRSWLHRGRSALAVHLTTEVRRA